MASQWNFQSDRKEWKRREAASFRGPCTSNSKRKGSLTFPKQQRLCWLVQSYQSKATGLGNLSCDERECRTRKKSPRPICSTSPRRPSLRFRKEIKAPHPSSSYLIQRATHVDGTVLYHFINNVRDGFHKIWEPFVANIYDELLLVDRINTRVLFDPLPGIHVILGKFLDYIRANMSTKYHVSISSFLIPLSPHMTPAQALTAIHCGPADLHVAQSTECERSETSTNSGANPHSRVSAANLTSIKGVSSQLNGPAPTSGSELDPREPRWPGVGILPLGCLPEPVKPVGQRQERSCSRPPAGQDQEFTRLQHAARPEAPSPPSCGHNSPRKPQAWAQSSVLYGGCQSERVTATTFHQIEKRLGLPCYSTGFRATCPVRAGTKGSADCTPPKDYKHWTEAPAKLQGQITEFLTHGTGKGAGPTSPLPGSCLHWSSRHELVKAIHILSQNTEIILQVVVHHTYESDIQDDVYPDSSECKPGTPSWWWDTRGSGRAPGDPKQLLMSRLLKCASVRPTESEALNIPLTTGIAWVTPSPLSMTIPVSVRSPTCRDVQDAAKASTAWTKDTETTEKPDSNTEQDTRQASRHSPSPARCSLTRMTLHTGRIHNCSFGDRLSGSRSLWTVHMRRLPLFQLEPRRAQKRGERRFLLCQKLLKKKRRNFTELKIKRLRKKFAQKRLPKARRKLIHEKAKHYHKEYRQMYRTEIRMARTARKAGNLQAPVEPIGTCPQDQRHQRCEPRGLEGAAASSPSPDLQGHLVELKKLQ
ncbi:hypothetical protein HPG69_004364 [Diceros bicornis minor]|uniref:Large ribosomal subunit protein uL30 N-terminal eukaryotes domain-containing protein n=1 Tax=Diceros bicornis minor TaxID=77932 RepID=A0A7J7E6Y5_DICBM|nr:hypothetical protein HPG69_004364 [Diceros bicornis minor]